MYNAPILVIFLLIFYQPSNTLEVTAVEQPLCHHENFCTGCTGIVRCSDASICISHHKAYAKPMVACQHGTYIDATLEEKIVVTNVPNFMIN